MKIIRSSKLSLKFSNQGKRGLLSSIIEEYGTVVNHFIDQFWDTLPTKSKLLAPVVNSSTSWLSFRMRQDAAREAVDMVKAVKERNANNKRQLCKPRHKGERMAVSHHIIEIQAGSSRGFDAWMHLSSIGNRVIFDLPVKFHEQYNRLAARGKRLNHYIVTKDCVQVCFEIETGAKKAPTECVGVDTGIKSLATLSTGERIGLGVEACIERVKRCVHGSKGHKRAQRALRQYIDITAKAVVKNTSLLVVENLTGISTGTKLKRRLSKNMRRSIGSWNWRYWLGRVEKNCEDTNVSFRTVSPYKTSQMCRQCGYADRRNRAKQDQFRCLACGHAEHADINASRNILARFLTGPYGAGCKAKPWTETLV